MIEIVLKVWTRLFFVSQSPSWNFRMARYNEDLCVFLSLEFVQPLLPHGSGVPTPHPTTPGRRDQATRPSAVFEDEVVLEEFELTPRACPARPALQTPPPVQPPSRAQPMADPARSRPSPLSLPHAAARSAQDPDTPPPPGLHAPSPLTAADNAATTAAAGRSRA